MTNILQQVGDQIISTRKETGIWSSSMIYVALAGMDPAQAQRELVESTAARSLGINRIQLTIRVAKELTSGVRGESTELRRRLDTETTRIQSALARNEIVTL